MPGLHPAVWALHIACVLMAAIFAFWVVRARPSDDPAADDKEPGLFRRSRLVSAALLLCSASAAVSLLGFGEGARLPLFVSVMVAILVGAGIGLISMPSVRRDATR